MRLQGAVTLLPHLYLPAFVVRYLAGERACRWVLTLDAILPAAAGLPSPYGEKTKVRLIAPDVLEVIAGDHTIQVEGEAGWVQGAVVALAHSEANRRALERKLKPTTVNVKIDQKKTLTSALRAFANKFAKKHGEQSKMDRKCIEKVVEEALLGVRHKLLEYEPSGKSVTIDKALIGEARLVLCDECIALLEAREGAELRPVEMKVLLDVISERHWEDGEALTSIFSAHASIEGRALISLTVVDDRVCLGLVNNRDEADTLDLLHLVWLIEEPGVPKRVRAGFPGRGKNDGTAEIVAVLEPRYGRLTFFQGMRDGRSIDDSKAYEFRRHYYVRPEALLIYFQVAKRDEHEQARFRQMRERAEQTLTSAHVCALLNERG